MTIKEEQEKQKSQDYIDSAVEDLRKIAFYYKRNPSNSAQKIINKIKKGKKLDDAINDGLEMVHEQLRITNYLMKLINLKKR